MASKTQIANMALGHIGSSRLVANVDTDVTTEAVQAKLYFDDDRDALLRMFPWKFATAYQEPALVSGSTASPTNHDWIFAYRYPSDGLFVRRIMTGLGRNPGEPPAFSIGRDAQGRLIYSNQEDAQIEYTYRVTEPGEFDALFVQALAWKLAEHMAPSLSRVEGAAAHAAEMFASAVNEAEAQSVNERQQLHNIEAEVIRARTGIVTTTERDETIYPGNYVVS